MSEPKFTPGPWKFVWQNNHDIQISFAGVVIGDDMKVIGHGNEQIANAHLIAAAPDLYRELEMARFTIAMEIATMGPRTLDREEKEALIAEHPTIKTIDVALKKARGES